MNTKLANDYRALLQPLGYCRQPPRVGIGQPTPPVDVPRNQVLVGDACARLRVLPASSIDSVITSPPYMALRRYSSDSREIGRENSVDDWVQSLRAMAREVARVLKPAGSFCLNLGDSFSNHPKWGAPRKSMLASGERVLLALLEDGWLLRSRLIWHKPNSRPTSAVDRLSLNYEYVYFLVRSPRYFFDLAPLRVPHKTKVRPSSQPLPVKLAVPKWAGPLASGNQSGLLRARLEGRPGHPDGKNPGSVFTIAPKGVPGHPAAWPPELVRRLILATCPKSVCSACGMPSSRTDPACSCGADLIKGLVLDPFFGSGTTGLIAEQLGRDWLGIELSPSFAALAGRRIKEARRGG